MVTIVEAVLHQPYRQILKHVFTAVVGVGTGRADRHGDSMVCIRAGHVRRQILS